MMNVFRQQVAASLSKAGFQPVSATMEPYRFICGSAEEVVYKRIIEGTLNEIVVIVRDNYVYTYVFRPSEGRSNKAVIYQSDAVYYDANKVLEKARFAWSVGRTENAPCQRFTAISGFKHVCGNHFTDDGHGGIVCSCKCWVKYKRRFNKRNAGYFA